MSPSDIIASVSKKFAHALDAGDLFFYPSTKTTVKDLDVDFEIRLCPALQKKSELPAPTPDLGNNPIAKAEYADEREKKRVDPFLPPYNPNLHVGDLKEDGAEYVVLLNKYAVLPDHFLLVTREFQSQSSPLMPSDLVLAYLLLVAARKAGKRYFAFYNCGENSGASQPHKHIQFIPVEDDGPPIESLARSANLETPGKPFSLTNLTYANHVARLPTEVSSYTPDKLEKTLSDVFLSLLDLVVSTIRHDPEYSPGKPSYNVLISLEHIHLIPRLREDYTLPQTGDTLSINALGFAGMLLVKSGEELQALKENGIGNVLRFVGLGSVHDIQVAETTE